MSLRVLFVNDDESVLAGLRASLRRQRRRWAMHFLGGVEAAARLETEHYDVVVVDVVLRDRDGLSLLKRVAEEHPSTVRVVLSGSADPKGAMRAIPFAHQYLSMPCDPAEIIRRIERSESLRSLLSEERIVVLGALRDLPTPHRLYQQLREALSDPDVAISDVAALVEQDPAMSAKILQLVNSAFFSRVRRITSVRDAVSFLGLSLLQGLVLQIGLFDAMEDSLGGISLEEASQHGLTVATAARRIAARDCADAAFTAGLLHDIGKLLLAVRFGARYAKLMARSEQSGEPLLGLEQEQLGVTHPEAGAYLLGIWGLPDVVVEGVAWHHEPRRIAHVQVDAVVAVHLADAIVAGQQVDEQLVLELRLERSVVKWRGQFEEAA